MHEFLSRVGSIGLGYRAYAAPKSKQKSAHERRVERALAGIEIASVNIMFMHALAHDCRAVGQQIFSFLCAIG